jgi:FADH2 O2-dependent halogenase
LCANVKDDRLVDFNVDVAVMGAGFGGSLSALILDRIGLKSILIDRGAHPRFAIGESSTPASNFVLRDLAQKYELPRLFPLTKYGPWQAAYPQIGCGLKRGFSYFAHSPNQAFQANSDHTSELLVAASENDATGDTHWLRADVDQFFASEAVAAGIPYLDRTLTSPRQIGDDWLIEGERQGEGVQIQAKFVIDATGEAALLPKTLNLGTHSRPLRTHSRGLFGHFANVKPWDSLLTEQNADVSDYPFCCDDAALHHVFDFGWMWQLRFNHGIVSAGFAIDSARHPLDTSISPEEEWTRLVDRFPSLRQQLASAELTQPPGGLRRTDRMQRHVAQIVGDNWALLPNTAGFIDPLHSTGIAHTLCGIERLMDILSRQWAKPALVSELSRYETALHQEIDLIDQLVHNCYAARTDFNLFTSATMLYFAMVVEFERRRVEGASMPVFLCADDAALRAVVEDLSSQLLPIARNPDRDAVQQYRLAVDRAIAPFNSAGLCDPRVRNMYRRTAK